MIANRHEQEGKTITPRRASMPTADENSVSENDIANSQDESPKKKHHSSAMYAARNLHNAVAYVKPTHPGLNL